MSQKKPSIVKYLLFGIVLFTFFSCKKDIVKYDLQGSVYDPQLKTTVADANISLKASKVESGVYNPSYVEIQSTKTAANGSYSFSVEQDLVSGYRMDISKKDYFDYSVDIKTEDLQKEDGLTLNADFIPIAQIKLIVKNTSPQAADDEIRFRFSNIDVNCKECWNNDVIIGTGPAYSYSETKQLTGEKNIIISWVVTKKGNQHIYQDTIASKAFSTLTYNINY